MAYSARSIPSEPRAVSVAFVNDRFVVELDDGRLIGTPVIWYPRLFDSTAEELANCEIEADGEAVRWPDIDEDISVAGLLRGAKGATGKWPGEARKREREQAA